MIKYVASIVFVALGLFAMNVAASPSSPTSSAVAQTGTFTGTIDRVRTDAAGEVVQVKAGAGATVTDDNGNSQSVAGEWIDVPADNGNDAVLKEARKNGNQVTFTVKKDNGDPRWTMDGGVEFLD